MDELAFFAWRHGFTASSKQPKSDYRLMRHESVSNDRRASTQLEFTIAFDAR